MTDVDTWIRQAAACTGEPMPERLIGQIALLIDAEPSPASFAVRRAARAAMLSSAFAALIGFGGGSILVTTATAKPAPTWVAAPASGSPFALLIGR